jgi:putative RecB family exonuclease
MTVYSYSRINTFFTCPAQFQFRYIERRPSPVAEGIELFLGSRFHETMEYLYHQIPQKVPTVNELVDFFKNHWQNHWKAALQKQKERNFPGPLRIVQEGQTVEDYYQKGLLFVENYYHQYHPFDQDKTEGIELKVAFDLDPKGQYKMQGYIDRLGRDDGGTLWVHDYKTSSRKMTAEDARNEDQLALYQAGLLQNPRFGAQERIKLIWHFVAFEKDQVIGERNAKEIGWLKEKYISKIQTIEKTKSFPTKTGVLCKWCEYLTVCQDGQKWLESRKKESPQDEAASKSKPEPALSSAAKASFKESENREPPEVPKAAPEPSFPWASSGSAMVSSKRKKRPSSVESPDQLRLF